MVSISLEKCIRYNNFFEQYLTKLIKLLNISIGINNSVFYIFQCDPFFMVLVIHLHCYILSFKIFYLSTISKSFYSGWEYHFVNKRIKLVNTYNKISIERYEEVLKRKCKKNYIFIFTALAHQKQVTHWTMNWKQMCVSYSIYLIFRKKVIKIARKSMKKGSTLPVSSFLQWHFIMCHIREVVFR